MSEAEKGKISIDLSKLNIGRLQNVINSYGDQKKSNTQQVTPKSEPKILTQEKITTQGSNRISKIVDLNTTVEKKQTTIDDTNVANKDLPEVITKIENIKPDEKDARKLESERMEKNRKNMFAQLKRDGTIRSMDPKVDTRIKPDPIKPISPINQVANKVPLKPIQNNTNTHTQKPRTGGEVSKFTSSKFTDNKKSGVKNQKDDKSKESKIISKDLQHRNKMIEKYGIKGLEMLENDNEDFETLTTILTEEDLKEVEISQSHIDEDDEKFFGKDLSFKAIEHQYFTTSVANKKSGRRQVKRYDAVVRNIQLSGNISVRDLAELISEKVGDVIKTLMKNGINSSMNEVLDVDTAELIANEMGHNVERVKLQTIYDTAILESENVNPTTVRTPIVTIIGHVDHGKTTLLDSIRKADVASKEHGGITQHIGAYTIKTINNDEITFLDTPGHAAFSSMRSMGTKITDIAVLVVAADDGIQPQTIEAIQHIFKAEIPMIVAINKIDKHDANPQKIKQDLLQHNVILEQFGGNIACVEISGKSGLNIDKLIEAINIQAEVLELKADLNARAFGNVIEARFDKNRGIISTIILKHGILKISDIIVCNKVYAKIKAIINDKGEKLTQLYPGIPAEIFGFESSPSAGDMAIFMNNEKDAREFISILENQTKDENINNKKNHASFESCQIKKKDINFIIKTDAHGSLDAISGMIKKLHHKDLNIKIIHKSVGNVSESDANLAKSINGFILCFNVVADARAKIVLQNNPEITMKVNNIIYGLIDDVKQILSSNLEPIRTETLIGKAEVRQVFGLVKINCVAGCMITSGFAIRGCIGKIFRKSEAPLTISSIKTIKRFKDDVKEAKMGYECGIQFNEDILFEIGDLMEFYEEKFTPQDIEN